MPDVWLIDDTPVQNGGATSTQHDPEAAYARGDAGGYAHGHARGHARVHSVDPFEDVEQQTQDLYMEMEDLDNEGHVLNPFRTHRPLTNPNDQIKQRDFDIVHLWNRILGKNKDTQPSGPRSITFPPEKKFRGNHISTTKYNVATFLPKFLFEQFSKYANLFFLATGCIQQVPHVSPTNPYTTFITLGIVLLVSALKEAFEDIKRAQADRELNRSETWVFHSYTGRWEQKKWLDIVVGDIIRVENEQPLPADVALLSTSEPEGLCYIETSNLDGETNLKIKQANEQTNHLRTEEQLRDLRLSIQSEQPNSSLYTFEGTLQIENTRMIPLQPDQMLLRGTSIRNTQWIIGVAVFTGHETKLMRNATAAPIKRTAVEHMINVQIVFLFFILITMALLCSIGNVIKITQWRSTMFYLQLESTSITATFFLDLLTYWILFSNLVPISLFVTVEIIKFYQGVLISSDLEMYYKETDTPTVCRTSSLVEELGQIGYIFSDKTGTLTRNVMEFKACSIAGNVYAQELPEDRQGDVNYYNFDQLRNDMDDARLGPDITQFFTLLATCHTVIPEQLDDGTLKYQASSPDEGALVDGAAHLGFIFTVRKPSSIQIEVAGREHQYELLNICEFNSTRKRMSTIFRCPDGRIRLFCKGADTVIFERLASREGEHMEVTMSTLEQFASEGLRTLCLASREIDEETYLEWANRYEAALTSLEDRQTRVDEVANEIEQELELLGATAIEDKLQEGVPETIHTLQDAGIKVWVLTGDRQETAINIGMSCKLLSEDMSLLIVNEDSAEKTRENLQKKLEIVRNPSTTAADLNSLALVIDGVSLGYALRADMEEMLFELAVLCKSVICCRVSPLQKALVVKLVKRYSSDLLLAIGDGANDVSMIQAAHVGVGISGMEGQQAARSADISTGQFRYLKKLLLVHGSWNYHRLSRAILYSFYKNIALYFTQFWYVFLNGFSGQSIYESWTVTFYNVVCTVLPPFCLGIFDQYVSGRMLQRYPQLYRLGQKGAFLNVRQFWAWIVNGIYHSIIVFFVGAGAYFSGNVLSDGLVANHWVWGSATYTACVLTVLGKAALVTNMWNKYTVVCIPGSFAIWLAFFPFYASAFPRVGVSKEYRGVLGNLYSSGVFWALILVVAVLCLMRDFAWRYYRHMYDPEMYHYVQEMQKYNITDQRPRMDQFQKAIRKVRQVQRMRKQRGFAFSQSDEGQKKVISAYDTSRKDRTAGAAAAGAHLGENLI